VLQVPGAEVAKIQLVGGARLTVVESAVAVCAKKKRKSPAGASESDSRDDGVEGVARNVRVCHELLGASLQIPPPVDCASAQPEPPSGWRNLA
jgi:hypothetical protein